MGANAQTSVPTFTAGEVLTAANMNISARTGIPVFADSTARDAAFGGTGEKVLAEGQFAYLESTNATQYYDGSTWQAVASASGLTLISSTTIGTAVSSVTVSNAFSATYDNYLITVTGGVVSTGSYLALTLGSTATGYYFGVNGIRWDTGGVTSDFISNGTSWFRAARGNSNTIFGFIQILNPFNTKNTGYTQQLTINETTGFGPLLGGGYIADNTSYTAFTFTTVTGGATMTGGTIRVYGYANS